MSEERKEFYKSKWNNSVTNLFKQNNKSIFKKVKYCFKGDDE